MFARMLMGKGYQFLKNRTALKVIGVSMAGCYAYSCVRRVPLTNRLQILPYPYCVDKLIGIVRHRRYQSHDLNISDKHDDFRRIAAILSRLRRIEEVKGHHEEDFHLILLDEPTKNFLSYPGGGIVVFNRFINSETEFQDDAILASVIAHEMGHVLARHQCEGGGRIYGSYVALVCSILATYRRPGPPGYIMTAGLLVLKYLEITTRYIPKQKKELEADYMGMKIMALAGYDPTSALKMMEMQCRRLGNIPAYSSHPPSEERLLKMQEHLPEVRGLYERGAQKNATETKEI